mgnify:CR=1 FL=1
MIKKIINFIISVFSDEVTVFYVGSADKLPEPLSKEDEIYYVERAMKGITSAKDKLIEHNLRLVVFLAKKYENTESNKNNT